MLCRICNSICNETYLIREMMFGLREVFTYVRCPHCRCLQIEHVPDDMAPYYPETYYSFGSASTSPADRYRGQLGIMKGLRILDVGSGSGLLLRALVASGAASGTGIDPYIPKSVT